MKLYLASSWKNSLYPPLLSMLRSWGHEVYDFRENGFSWYEVYPSWNGDDVLVEEIIPGLTADRAKEGFNRYVEALNWAEACILCLPCGNSAHAEFGYAVGKGKLTAVVLPYSGNIRPDLLWNLANLITSDTTELKNFLDPPF
jgi:hypothetical protein